MKKIVLSILFTLQAMFVFSQASGGLSGKIVDSKTQKPLANVVVSVQNTNLTEVTDAEGKFAFLSIPVGNQLAQIRNSSYKDQLLKIEIEKAKILDLGVIVLEEDVTEDEKVNLITISDSDLDDDSSGSENTSSLLQASRDVFLQTAAFNWGLARFRTRGLDNAYGSVMINGIVMNKILDSRPQYSNWGGLNDATRNQEFTNGSAPSDYTFGGILGTQEINTRASSYRPGNRISVAGSNSTYTGRLMGTTASGMRNDGWAYVVSASRRYTNDGFFEGTTYNGNSFFASVEKKLSSKNSLNLTTIYGQNTSGRTSGNTQEVTDLKGYKYNSFWGYQDGKKRNTRYRTVEEPVFMLSDYWKVTPKTNLTTTLAYQFGKIGNSRLTYQGADNPDPTYYKSLPSYETSLYDLNGNYTPDFATAAAKRESFLADGQVNWSQLIYANQNSGDGHSYYTSYEDRIDDKQFTANTVLSSQLADNILLNAGATYRNLNSHNFQNLLDLLGGSYFKDVNLFGTVEDLNNIGTGSQQQNDLNNPNRKVVVGDAFGYNYNLFANTIDAFTQFKFIYKKVDFYIANSYSRSEYQREGLYRNGYYPSNSFGKSEKLNFDNFGFKGGLTYKISGTNFLNFNAVYMTKAPNLRNSFNNARVNNFSVEGLGNEIISSADASFIINRPKLKMRLTAFYSKIKNQTKTAFFFGDGAGVDINAGGTNETSSFVSQTITNIDNRNIGLEFGFEYPITSTLKVSASAAYGEYIISNNPTVSINQDGNASSTLLRPTFNLGEANLKNYKQAGTPQQAASVGLEYRDPKFWFIAANMNYLGSNYVDVAALNRTSRFYDNAGTTASPGTPGVPVSDATTARGAELLKQEKLPDFALLNINGGKSWRVGKNTIGFSASISNALDRIYKTGGFEQARNSNFTQANQDFTAHTNPLTNVTAVTPSFGPKYFYGFGRTFLVNLYINF